jgi:hypothetical protein
MLFQRFPHRPPVLRGRLHNDFLDVLRDQPVGQAAQIGRRRPDLLAVEVKVAALIISSLSICSSVNSASGVA